MKIINLITASFLIVPVYNVGLSVANISCAVPYNLQVQQQKIYDQTFVFRNDNITQTLMCDWPKDGKVNFKYINNPVGGKESVISGIAAYISSEGTGVDEEGNGYFIEEYEFMNGCSIVLQLDSDENRRAKVIVRNCPKGNSHHAFNSAGIMQLQD